MRYDHSFFDEPIDRRGTACEKWDALMEREKRELLPMWVADMDIRCPLEVRDALVARAQHPVYGYTEQTEAAVDAMLAYMERRHQVRVTRDEQLLMPCVVTGLKAAVRALTKPGDGVIIQPPVYGPFFYSIQENGRELLENRLLRDENGRYAMDYEGLESLCRKGAKLMLLCSPHNPVGRNWSREELQRLLSILTRYGVTLISDEIHEDFVYPPARFVSALSLPGAQENGVVTLTSVSKTFNLAGLQQSVMLTRDPAIKEAVAKEMRASGVTQGNIFALAATEAAYRYGDPWLDALLPYLAEACALLRDELAARLPAAVMSPLEATYLAWIDLRAYGFSNDELMRRTYDKGVAFTPGVFFGKESGDGFLRVNLACPHAQTLEAVKRLERAIKE